MKFIFPQDMSSIWKTTGHGGTTKVKSFPCYCCAVTTATLVMPQPKEKCFRGDRGRQPKCYHQPMVTSDTFDAWRHQRADLENTYPHLLNPSADMNKLQVFLSSTDELWDDQNPYDFSFAPTSIQEGRQFDNLFEFRTKLPTNARGWNDCRKTVTFARSIRSRGGV